MACFIIEQTPLKTSFKRTSTITLHFPMAVKHITKFENSNFDCSINIFQIDDSALVTPLKVVKPKSDHTDQLLVTDNQTGESHYVMISRSTFDSAVNIKPA